ncbi:MAG: response regulator transcription factor [Syntrophaceticus sp.]|mgnify:FL=1|nr:response regulator transcription factor [Syntrophaceticus sp.]MDD4783987.1 response regulator transcription factor [Syntrophaceticus sp.]
MSSKVLIVDDEEAIVKLVSFNLEKEGFETLAAYDGREALDIIRREPLDLVVLDVMLPEMDGLSLCRQLRLDGIQVPILMLTAKDGEIDKVLGLEIGADDYLTKPFSPRELVARVRALLRRTKEAKDEPEELLKLGSLEIFPLRYEVRRDGRELDLTSREFELLLLFCQNKGIVMSREQILEKVWGYDFYGDARVVDVHIRHLREKIEIDPSNPRYIKTVRGVGYKLQQPEELM